ncbi:hypothetical protein DPMN_040552 [Dreissena polymorpha]|uniref:Uncharacterized protein n=1 Tax=Dreissena polymorpha TaxID=45954 RepID=A0A9D4CX51_DREPO|nr:hypothetical protein DPMN_040552 [Dreissena polymorpha]
MLTSGGFSPCTFITAGSKAEGLACWNNSDLDRLLLMNSGLCVEGGINAQTIPDDMQVYRMDTRVNPGHCRMFLERCGSHTRLFEFKNAICDDGKGNALLSSGLLLEDVEQSLKCVLHTGVPLERMGPSIPNIKDKCLVIAICLYMFRKLCYAE